MSQVQDVEMTPAVEKQMLEDIKARPRITITVTGPVGRGKTIILAKLRNMLQEEFAAKTVLLNGVSAGELDSDLYEAHVKNMEAALAENVYLLSEETVVQVAQKGE